MITADQLLAHAVGDYLLQSDWMATEKTKQSTAAAVHALCYTIPFLFIVGLSGAIAPLVVIAGTHFVIDRWRLARYIVWAKNWLGPNRPWSECVATGYPLDRPAWMTVWLLIIVDNVLHVTINGLALKYL